MLRQWKERKSRKERTSPKPEYQFSGAMGPVAVRLLNVFPIWANCSANTSYVMAGRNEDEEMAARRWGDEMRDNDKSTNMQKRGAPQKGRGVCVCVCWFEALSHLFMHMQWFGPKITVRKKRSAHKTKDSEHKLVLLAIANRRGCRAPKSGTKQQGVWVWESADDHASPMPRHAYQ